MARTSLESVLSLQDPAQSWNFDLFLPSIPGSSNTRNLTFSCMTTVLPGMNLDVVEVPLHGVQLDFAGRATYSRTFNATFLEMRDWGTREMFRRWRESIRSWDNNSGSFASAYKVTADLVVYNDIPQPVRTIRVFGVWPEQIADIQLDGGASNVVTTEITFHYDFHRDVTEA